MTRNPVAEDTSLSNLMVVLRESQETCRTEATLVDMGPATGTWPDGTEFEIHQAWFEFIGDMHIRFVFDSPRCMHGLTIEEFAAFHLSPEEAVRVAIANMRRLHGVPQVSPWSKGVMLVYGKSPDFDSSYFLDEDFWQELLKQHPEGLVAAVPKRGGLLFVPVTDEPAVLHLRKGIHTLFTTSEQMRVSSGLYLYKDSHWSVFQAPVGT